MLEALTGGLHTANIGNLKPGDELVVEVRYAQLLAFEQGRLRLAIPTTIAPRYGNAASAGLQPQQVPQASPLAEYPLALSVTIAGGLTSGTVECPTHRFAREAVDGGMRFDLAAGAWLDRDVVIVVTPREPLPAIVIQAHDGVAHAAPVVVMAALKPPPTKPRPRLALKLLVDCSGSMAGDSIASARIALHGALAGLTEHDQVSLSCFGSTVQHVLAPSFCTPQTLQRAMPAVDTIDANLGGTEMEAALKAVFELPVPEDFAGADVLLVTDGEIWQAEEMIAAASASGHRVFAIGVGSSPAEGVLRSLAEATGGACEFATPGEALEAAAARMLVRIRQQSWKEARIDWGCEPVWQTAMPTSLFGGDTVIAFAGVKAQARAAAVRLLAKDSTGAVTELARGEADAPCPGDTLARMAASRRLSTFDPAQAPEMAVAYQLLSQHTNCILVHERADADTATEEAELNRVSSMLAAGWSATSTVMERMSISFCAVDMEPLGGSDDVSGMTVPSVWRSGRDANARRRTRIDPMVSPSPAATDIPAFLRRQSNDSPPASLEDIAAAVFAHLLKEGAVDGLSLRCEALDLSVDVRDAIIKATGLGLGIDDAWLMLAHWANGQPDAMSDQLFRVTFQPHVDRIDTVLFVRCMELFDQTLGANDAGSAGLSRTERLQRALDRSSP